MPYAELEGIKLFFEDTRRSQGSAHGEWLRRIDDRNYRRLKIWLGFY